MNKKIKIILDIILFIISVLYVNDWKYLNTSELSDFIIILSHIFFLIGNFFIVKVLYSFFIFLIPKIFDMDKRVKKRINKIIKKILCVILIALISNFLVISLVLESKILGVEAALKNILPVILVPLSIWFVIFIVFQKYFVKIFSKLGKFDRILKQIDKSDINFDKEYYREILREMSPLILSYIDNFDINKNRLIAEILYLERKGLIEISNDKLLPKGNYLSQVIPAYQKMILERIQKGKLEIECLEKYLNALRDTVAVEVEKLNLVNEKVIKKNEKKSKRENYKRPLKNKKSKNIWIDNLFLYIKVILFAVCPFIPYFAARVLTGKYLIYMAIIVFVITCSMVGTLLIYLWWLSYKESKGNRFYTRTPKGKNLNKKLEGLKHYLKDYSLLSEREAKEIELWEDYLIYSVMFGQNIKVIEEYEKYIEVEEDNVN